VTVTIATQPTQGSVTAAGGNGVFRYQKQAGATGSDSFTYEVCSVECPDLCSTATVTITIQSGSDNPQIDKDLPMNAITPNGDGRNDELVFDVLLEGASKFPNNEIIIFNRWGDIIYQASPYNNDWRGTNSTGQELPDGTYYYILRLDIGEGDIIKGDVTILK
jgi:gliding motility-associated-like protein